MSYTAIIAPITAIRPIPKADRLLAATVLGNTVVVGLDAAVGDRGIYFPVDGILSDAHCAAHDLKMRVDENGARAGGFFDAERPRVRAQRFRGEKSEGFWQPLSALAYTGVDLTSLRDGDEFTTVNGVEICRKYETPATKRAAAANQKKSNRRETPFFKMQPDTTQFRFVADHLFTPGATIYITEKVHGTSQRTGLVLDTIELPWWKRVVNGALRKDVFAKRAYRLLNGSKNVILEKSTGAGYYGSHDFRYEVIADWAERIQKGEVFYYEIVGDVADGSPIMPSCPIPAELKDLKRTYGDTMHYRYGCAPGTRAIYVYRITRTNEDGIVTELSWNQVKARCAEIGIAHVPEIQSAFAPLCGNPEVDTNILSWLRTCVEKHTEGVSLLDATHIREGVVVRVEDSAGARFAKNKSFSFYVLEGVIKLKDGYIDCEESS